jgi:hypothetical protein
MASNANDQKQRDNQREKKLQVIRVLEQFLIVASDPQFAGSLVVELNAKDGFLGRVKHSTTTFEPQ